MFYGDCSVQLSSDYYTFRERADLLPSVELTRLHLLEPQPDLLDQRLWLAHWRHCPKWCPLWREAWRGDDTGRAWRRRWRAHDSVKSMTIPTTDTLGYPLSLLWLAFRTLAFHDFWVSDVFLVSKRSSRTPTLDTSVSHDT